MAGAIEIPRERVDHSKSTGQIAENDAVAGGNALEEISSDVIALQKNDRDRSRV